MKAFFLCVSCLLPLLANSSQYGQPPSYGGYQRPQQQYGGYQPAPTYQQHPPSYQQPERPKNNCTVEDVVEQADVCTPTLETRCENVNVPVKKIAEGEYCYEVMSTVCTETSETVDNEVCSYTYTEKQDTANGQTVEVTFEKRTNVQMVTVCQPQPSGYGGYGHQQSYGHQYCKEVAQETAYNVPVVKTVNVPVQIAYPEPVRTCVNKPITLPRLRCEPKVEQKCVNQPRIEDSFESVEKCTVQQGTPKCQRIELTLPKQVCKEIVYGYAEDKPKTYQPASQPPVAPPSYPSPAPPSNQYQPAQPKPTQKPIVLPNPSTPTSGYSS